MAVNPPGQKQRNFTYKRLLVKLRKGWNDVMIKLPVGSFSTPETRLVKWMFTFVFTTPDGSREADLIYDPDAQAPGKIRPQGK